MSNTDLVLPEPDSFDAFLGRLAAESPAASYVRTLGSTMARRSMTGAICQAAELLAPGAIPKLSGRGISGNQRERFTAACRLPWGALRVERLGELRASLIQAEYAPATANKILAAVRGVLHHAWLSGAMTAEAVARAKACLKTVRGVRVQRGQALNKSQVRAIISSALERGGLVGHRDAVVIALLAVGLRRSEVASLRLENFDSASGRLIIRGKGNKERVLTLTNGSLEATNDWLRFRGAEPGDTGSLLLAIGKDGRSRPQGISQQAVASIFARHAKAAGLSATCHDLRRTFASDALQAGVDIFTLQALMGHASPTTTQRYDKRQEGVRAKAMGLIHVPYGKWG
jgi:site-specific recombinase XerD